MIGDEGREEADFMPFKHINSKAVRNQNSFFRFFFKHYPNHTKEIRIQFVPFVILISHDTSPVIKIYQDDKGLNNFLGYGCDVFEKITNEMFDYSEQQEVLMTEEAVS